MKQENAPVEESVLTDIHMSVNTDLRENAGESKTCVYQHKALDTANEKFYDDEEDSESKKIDVNAKDKGCPSKNVPFRNLSFVITQLLGMQSSKFICPPR